jgi:multidrug resistance efflux pump
VAAEVFVHVGEEVAAGTPLFRLDDRSLQAELQVREARRASGQAQLARLEQMPRTEEVTASASRVAEARAYLAMQQARLDRAEAQLKARLLSNEEAEQFRQAVVAARKQLDRAEIEDHVLRGGAWEADKAVARATVAEAESLVAQMKTELQRLTVCARGPGTVLQVNVRASEAVGARTDLPPIVMGVVRPLRVRVDVPEHQIGLFQTDAPATAVPRGRPNLRLPLRFVRVEPMVVPRRIFRGETGERSDSRVLQVLYDLDPGTEPIHVGQPLDVFIEAKPVEMVQ